MKKSIFFLWLTTICFAGCKNGTESVLINENISIRLPSDYSVTEEGNKKTFEADLENDRIKVFKILINLPDTLNSETKKQYFITNINSFLTTFDFANLDTTISYQGNHLQSEISFDYNDQNKPKKFYGRFIGQNQDFIAICYQMSNPDKISSKNKLFTSIKIK